MDDYVISLDDPAAADAACVGPKAANLAVLAQAGLPTPGDRRARCQRALPTARSCGRWRCLPRIKDGCPFAFRACTLSCQPERRALQNY